MLIIPINSIPFGKSETRVGKLTFVNTTLRHPVTGEYKYGGAFEKYDNQEDVQYILHCDEMFHYREDGALDLVRKFVNDFVSQIKQKGLPR